MSPRLDPLDADLLRDSHRKKFLELKFSYEHQLDEKDRDLKRHAARLDRLKQDLDRKEVMRLEVEDQLKDLRRKNETLGGMIVELENTKTVTHADLKADVRNT